jgi:phospholipid transport system substrate-binding protein
MQAYRCPEVLVLSLVLALAPASALAGPAADSFRSEHERLLGLVSQDAEDAALGKQLDAMLDYHWLAEASLGGAANYAAVCGDRCAEFEQLLTTLIRQSYLEMARSAQRYPLDIVDEVEGKNGVYKLVTKVQVERNGRQRNIRVDYVMHQVDGRWQVRDIITDDVSLVRTYQHEFNKLARSEGIDGIMKRLQEKLGS